MTLDEMYLEAARYCSLQTKVVKSGSPPAYAGQAQIITDLFRSGINKAKDMIARQRFAPSYKGDTVTLDANLQFDITTLTKTFLGLVSLVDVNGNDVEWDWVSTTTIKCPNNTAGDVLTPTYEYLPADLVNLTDTWDMPPGIVDPKILCEYAAYWYFKSKDSDKQISWLQDFNNDFDNIEWFRGEPTQVQVVW